jgi:hypothetical protein
MKKSFVMSGAVALAVAGLLLAGCGSAPAASGSTSKRLGGVPDFVNDAYLSASEDVIIGIGTYKIGNDMSKMGTGKTFAETRARADIARQLGTIVKNMVNDYTATSELDPTAAVSFQENITQALAKAELKGSRTMKIELDDNGLLWVVMEFSKSAAQTEVNQAANAAKLAVPAAAAFDALQRMDTAFTKAAGGGPVPVSQ